MTLPLWPFHHHCSTITISPLQLHHPYCTMIVPPSLFYYHCSTIKFPLSLFHHYCFTISARLMVSCITAPPNLFHLFIITVPSLLFDQLCSTVSPLLFYLYFFTSLLQFECSTIYFTITFPPLPLHHHCFTITVSPSLFHQLVLLFHQEIQKRNSKSQKIGNFWKGLVHVFCKIFQIFLFFYFW